MCVRADEGCKCIMQARTHLYKALGTSITRTPQGAGWFPAPGKRARRSAASGVCCGRACRQQPTANSRQVCLQDGSCWCRLAAWQQRRAPATPPRPRGSGARAARGERERERRAAARRGGRGGPGGRPARAPTRQRCERRGAQEGKDGRAQPTRGAAQRVRARGGGAPTWVATWRVARVTCVRGVHGAPSER